MRETQTEPTHCPYCGVEHDGATDFVGDAVPSPGDGSVCIQCGGLSCFDEEMQLVKMPPEEIERAIRDHPHVANYMFAVRAAHAKRS